MPKTKIQSPWQTGARKHWLPNHALRNRGMRICGMGCRPARHRETSSRDVRDHEWERDKMSRRRAKKKTRLDIKILATVELAHVQLHT